MAGVREEKGRMGSGEWGQAHSVSRLFPMRRPDLLHCDSIFRHSPLPTRPFLEDCIQWPE